MAHLQVNFKSDDDDDDDDTYLYEYLQSLWAQV